jgi:hypothetical protein
MAYGTVNADVIGTSVSYQSSQIASLGAGNSGSLKNRIINGQMLISQVYGSSSTTTNGYTIDRWSPGSVSGATLTSQQVSDAPYGFQYSYKLTITAATTNNDLTYIYQGIELSNMNDVAWGTTNGQTMTASFWVKSSVAGQMNGTIIFYGNTATYIYSPTYTINSANTWEYKTVVIPPAPTAAGPTSATQNGKYMNFAPIAIFSSGYTTTATAGNTWANLSGTGYRATGSTANLASTAGATFQFTGVQFEVGGSATGFDYRNNTTELALCLRYRYVPVNNDLTGTPSNYSGFVATPYNASSSATCGLYMPLPVPMRGLPAITVTDPSANLGINWNGSGGWSGANTFTVASWNALTTNGTSNSYVALRINFNGNNSVSTVAIGAMANLNMGAGSQIVLTAEI